MRVTIARNCGFCSGVRRAINIARKNAPAHTLGPLVHNKRVISQLEEIGVHVTDSPDVKGTIITRAHGTPKDEMREGMIDATCPGVYSLHIAALEFEAKGYYVLIYGNENHPEIKALVSYLHEAEVTKEPTAYDKPVACVSQTTMSPVDFHAFVDETRRLNQKTLHKDTICRATQERQEAAIDLAKKVDLMIVIGGFHSSNTYKLAEVCKPYCPTYHIESVIPDEAWKVGHIGITAGASTPDEQVQEIYQLLQK
ncbi:MAG: 4-hydroxy-3-methylbut-2-enyl diphosphate reductase [Candidatus Woesearchaeota archaeon]